MTSISIAKVSQIIDAHYCHVVLLLKRCIISNNHPLNCLFNCLSNVKKRKCKNFPRLVFCEFPGDQRFHDKVTRVMETNSFRPHCIFYYNVNRFKCISVFNSNRDNHWQNMEFNILLKTICHCCVRYDMQIKRCCQLRLIFRRTPMKTRPDNNFNYCVWYKNMITLDSFVYLKVMNRACELYVSFRITHHPNTAIKISYILNSFSKKMWEIP